MTTPLLLFGQIWIRSISTATINIAYLALRQLLEQLVVHEPDDAGQLTRVPLHKVTVQRHIPAK